MNINWLKDRKLLIIVTIRSAVMIVHVTRFNKEINVLHSLHLVRLCHRMLSAVVLRQSTVSSSRKAKPSVPFGGWYRGQEASM